MSDEGPPCRFVLEDIGGSVYGGPVGVGRPCRWKLIGPEGVIATSEQFADRDQAIEAIEWVRKNAPACELGELPESQRG